ncbi:MAG: SurA N-terminal domain-containing protein [Hyphomonadaceae bacterium]|nr:SurA N-terminal domain-containing protein [Hyphomonadaceae bacterium]
MLGWMRKFVKSKWAFTLLFIPLIISFGIFGFNDPFQGVSGGGFVQVGDHQVRQKDVNDEVDQELERARQETGKVFSHKEAAQQGLTQQVLTRQIYRASVLAFGDKIGVKASPSAVTNALNSTPAFKDSLGRLDLDAVRDRAGRMGFNSVAAFEEALRNDMTVNYIQTAAFSGLSTPEVLTKPLMTYFGETRTVIMARLSGTSIPEPKAPTDAELKAWYDKNTARFAQPERRRISVLTYSAEDFKDKVQISEADIKASYDKRIREFSEPETRNIAQFSGTREELQTFVDIVKQGVSLEDALKRSQSVTRMDLMVKPGDLKDKQYDEGVFSFPANQLLGPFQVGEAAWYAVQVMSITPGPAKPLPEVSEQVKSDLQVVEAKRMFDASYDTFYDMAGGVSLEEIGAEIGAPVIQLMPTDAGGMTVKRAQSSLLTKHSEALRSLFSLSAGQMTDVIEEENERGLFRVDEIVAPYTLSFEDAKADVRLLYLAEQVKLAAGKLTNDMVAAVKSGRTFEQAAAASKMTVLGAVQLIRGSEPRVDPQVQEFAYTMKAGDTAVARGAGGEPWVLRLDKVEPLSPEMEAMMKAQISTQIEQTLLSDVQEAFFRGVQKEVTVKTNQKAIDDYFANLTKDEAQ